MEVELKHMFIESIEMCYAQNRHLILNFAHTFHIFKGEISYVKFINFT